MLAAFQAAGLAESHLGWLQGNFYGGGPGPTEVTSARGPGPAGARPLLHRRRRVGSHDENGEEVDTGTTRSSTANREVPVAHREFGYDGEVVSTMRSTGDIVTFDVALPEECEDASKDVYAWALSAFASGNSVGPWRGSRLIGIRGPACGQLDTTEPVVEVAQRARDANNGSSPSRGVRSVHFLRFVPRSSGATCEDAPNYVGTASSMLDRDRLREAAEREASSGEQFTPLRSCRSRPVSITSI